MAAVAKDERIDAGTRKGVFARFLGVCAELHEPVRIKHLWVDKVCGSVVEEGVAGGDQGVGGNGVATWKRDGFVRFAKEGDWGPESVVAFKHGL